MPVLSVAPDSFSWPWIVPRLDFQMSLSTMLEFSDKQGRYEPLGPKLENVLSN